MAQSGGLPRMLSCPWSCPAAGASVGPPAAKSGGDTNLRVKLRLMVEWCCPSGAAVADKQRCCDAASWSPVGG